MCEPMKRCHFRYGNLFTAADLLSAPRIVNTKLEYIGILLSCLCHSPNCVVICFFFDRCVVITHEFSRNIRITKAGFVENELLALLQILRSEFFVVVRGPMSSFFLWNPFLPSSLCVSIKIRLWQSTASARRWIIRYALFAFRTRYHHYHAEWLAD